MKQGWERKTLKEIAEYTIGLTYSPSDVSEKGMIVLRSSNIQNGKIDLSDLVRVTKVVKPKLIVKTGDILMCSRNGSTRLVGKTAVIPELDEAMTFGTFMTVIRSPFNPFLSYFFASDEFRKQITRGENPSIKQVTQYMLDDIEINLPPLSEQQRIVSVLEALSAETEHLEEIYWQKIEALKELKRSVLQKALEGEL
ncbi:MAG: restriction endonuclease subunit S [Anaerolineales bacterium]|nr:restriction endonuclease subunit S [Anaerolineales bacterium]